jgi:diguanylate cyclase
MKIRILKRSFFSVIFLCYVTATIFKSDFWGNLLSPVITLETAYLIYKAFFMGIKIKVNRVPGLFLTFGILSWAIADTLWAVYDLALHINPNESGLITYTYSLTNLFLTLSLSLYGFQIFRKWNIVQMLLDSFVMSFFVIYFIWAVFLDEDVKKLLKLRSDWNSTACIILDILVIMWIVIWYISVRNGSIPLYLRFMSAGTILFSIVDLIYYYQYLFSTYEPNSLLDAAYITSFRLIALSAVLHMNKKGNKSETVLYNTGRKGKGHYLFLAPILLIIFRGFDITILLHFLSAIAFYFMLSYYIQSSIYKEGLLRKEQDLNIVLEQKVKERTEELVEKNKILRHLLNQDYNTGLYNRRYLSAYLEKATASLKDGETIILLHIGINRIRMITTMFGHYVGDKILNEIAQRLKPLNNRTKDSILATYSDDTYIFAAIGQKDSAEGYDLAQEAVRLCSDIYRIEDYQIRITVNIGMSVYPLDAENKEELIKHADIAMTQAGMSGYNLVQAFDAKLSEVMYRKNMIELMLKRVNFNQEFMVYYQPQLHTKSGKIIGFEALLRWKTQNGEFIAPNEFIPVAEETGYIIPIGDWVMRRAIMQICDWNCRFKEKVMIGINVSIKQLNSLQFIENLKAEIASLGAKPEWIDLEITESQHLQENPDVLLLLEEIRRLGVSISIDDFGTGYSSLSYLKGLPADRIKLAKELIDYIHTDDFDYQLVKSIILLSRLKGIRVIAEGIETKEQWDALKELQCDEVQGYYFGRPVPTYEIEETFGDILMED